MMEISTREHLPGPGPTERLTPGDPLAPISCTNQGFPGANHTLAGRECPQHSPEKRLSVLKGDAHELVAR